MLGRRVAAGAGASWVMGHGGRVNNDAVFWSSGLSLVDARVDVKRQTPQQKYVTSQQWSVRNRPNAHVHR
jgi:hypothetical protein